MLEKKLTESEALGLLNRLYNESRSNTSKYKGKSPEDVGFTMNDFSGMTLEINSYETTFVLVSFQKGDMSQGMSFRLQTKDDMWAEWYSMLWLWLRKNIGALTKKSSDDESPEEYLRRISAKKDEYKVVVESRNGEVEDEWDELHNKR